MDWGIIVSGVLGILAVVCGVKWMLVKILIKKLAKALAVVSAGVEDDKLTRKECKEIAEAFADVIIAATKVAGR